jgi:hypothetical protein
MATDWAALKVEYVNRSLQYKELADKHGLKEGTVRQRANREGWAEERNALSRAVTQKATVELVDTRADDLAKFNEDDLKMARAIRAKAARMMANDLSPQDLRALAGAVDAAQKVGRLALGVSTSSNELTGKDGAALTPPVIQIMQYDDDTDSAQ